MKGKRTTTNNFEKDAFTVEAGSDTGKPASGFANTKNETKTNDTTRRCIIDSSYTPEEVIKLNTEGWYLVFEQKEGFLPLPEEMVKLLSRENKLNYEIAKQFHDTWRGNEHRELVEKFTVDKQLMGSAQDKLRIEAQPGMHVRWVAPYNIQKMLAKGYKILDKDEATSFLGPTGGHHQVGRLGFTELVAMGLPEEVYQKRLQEKTKQNLEKAGAWKEYGLASMNRDGGSPFDATESDKRAWTDLPDTSED